MNVSLPRNDFKQECFSTSATSEPPCFTAKSTTIQICEAEKRSCSDDVNDYTCECAAGSGGVHCDGGLHCV